MKKEELFETLQNLDDELIREAEGHVVKKSKSRKLYAYASIAAVFMLALIAGRLLMRFIEAVTRAAEHNDDPGHTQDRGLYAFLILVLLALSVIIIPYLLLQGVQDVSFVSSKLPWSAVQAAQRITSIPVWSRIIYGLDEFNRRIPLVYLVYTVLGSGLWASRPRKRKKLKKSGSYSIPTGWKKRKHRVRNGCSGTVLCHISCPNGSFRCARLMQLGGNIPSKEEKAGQKPPKRQNSPC